VCLSLCEIRVGEREAARNKWQSGRIIRFRLKTTVYNKTYRYTTICLERWRCGEADITPSHQLLEPEGVFGNVSKVSESSSEGCGND
jgi:hypothetical protein